VFDVLRNHFKPEFLNRIDDIVIFDQLSKSEIEKIIEVQLERLRKNLAERGISIVLEESAKELLANEGYDPTFGARPLKRAIQTLIQNPLAVKLLKGEIASGQTVHVVAENGALKFTPETTATAAA
jgi:ATP-dependent Clp protease ATP-binding subunit ClpB